MVKRILTLLCVVAVAALAVASRGGAEGVALVAGPTVEPHVMVIMEENQGYAATLGACGSDPYLCSLASSYASATSWYGTRHPSQPNYLAVASGSTQGCTVDNCVGAGAYSVQDLGGQLTSAGIPWAAYMESMPSACYTGTGYGGEYVLKHNPFIPFTDNLQGACHILPYPGASGLTPALNAANAPDFVWISPNLTDDMHNGTVQQADAWLKANLAPVLSSAWFTNFPSTVLITMDEGDGSTNSGSCCGAGLGGHVPMVVISSNAKGQGNVALTGDHYGTLRSIEEAYGLPLLGAAASAANGDLSGTVSAADPASPTPVPTGSPSGSPAPSPSATPRPSPSPSPSPSPFPSPSPSPSPSPTGSGGRNPLDQPFASTSIWNMPIGSGARYAPADLAPVKGLSADPTTVLMDPQAPEAAVEQGPTSQTGQRCALGGRILATVPIPASLTVPNGPSNSDLAAVGSDGMSLIEGNRFARCSASQPASASGARSTGTLYDSGQSGATGGSGLSTLGGVLRAGDLAPGSETLHALRINIDGETSLFRGTSSTCYRWPAVRCDGYGPSRYGGSNPQLTMGALLAIPQSVNLASLGLRTEAAQELAWTLQNYGAYVVNDAARPVASLGTEQGDASFTAQFQQEWGYSFQTVGAGAATPWAADIQTILGHLDVVTNNAPTSIGGGGAPLQPLALALTAPS